VENLQWPFLWVVDSRQQQTGWVLVNGPIVTHAQQEQFAELRRRNHRFVGMSSYLTFPLTEDADTLEYETVCEAWCHCFREPDRYLKTDIPRALISFSDFTDFHRISPQNVFTNLPAERFDFVYVGATEGWKKAAKNWRLAGRCISRMCSELGLRALVIGTPNEDFAETRGVTFVSQLPWHDFLAHLVQSRFLFVPNVMDPSPKLLGEALSLNVPLVMHKEILGGWKYINAFTGVFFEGEEDVTAAVRACLSKAANPRDWFRVNYGPYLSGERLLRLLRSVDPSISEQSHLCLVESESVTDRPATGLRETSCHLPSVKSVSRPSIVHDWTSGD
jgi:hypothetical protein